MFRCTSALRALALSLLLLGSTAMSSGCAPNTGGPASQTSKEQNCPGGNTPVVDRDWNPHGCNAAPNNVATEGSSCSGFKTGWITTDITGRTYECR
jgi:hypothetical protein